MNKLILPDLKQNLIKCANKRQPEYTDFLGFEG